MAMSILVPIDDSPCSLAALEHAARTFEDPDIHLLHVYDPVGASYDPTAGLKLPGFGQSWYESAQSKADQLFSDARGRTEQFDAVVDETSVTVGRPARAIVWAAESRNVDQIVIGSHGRRGIARLLHGSVSESVLRRASVPVTVVH